MASAILLVCASLAGAQSRYTVTVEGNKVGKASIAQKLGNDGSLRVALDLQLNFGGATVRAQGEALYSKAGRPISERFQASSPEGNTTSKVVYGKSSVVITTTEDGKTVKRTIANPKGPLEAPSTFWFIRDKPKKGVSVKFMNFDPDDLKWTQKTATYVGPQTIVVRGKKRQAHFVRESDVDSWQDDKGQILRLVMKLEGVTLLLELE